MALPSTYGPNVYVHSPGQNNQAAYIKAAAKRTIAAPMQRLPGNTGYGMLNPGTTLPQQQSVVGGGTAPAAPGPTAPKQNAALDYSGDPILGQVKAANLAAGNQQEQTTNDQINQALLHLGSHDLAAKLLPAGSNILGQISEDPWHSTSTLGQLNYQNIQNVAGSNNASAVDNTIFGTAHAQNLFDINRTGLINREGAIGDTNSQIQQLLAGLASYKQGLLQQNISAEGDAYQRAVQAAGQTGATPSLDPTLPPETPDDVVRRLTGQTGPRFGPNYSQ